MRGKLVQSQAMATWQWALAFFLWVLMPLRDLLHFILGPLTQAATRSDCICFDEGEAVRSSFRTSLTSDGSCTRRGLQDLNTTLREPNITQEDEAPINPINYVILLEANLSLTCTPHWHVQEEK